VHSEDAEQPLDRALLEVERLDAGERDVGLLGREQPRPFVDAVVVDEPAGRVPPPPPGQRRDGDADRPVEQAVQQRADVEAAAEHAQQDDDHQR
jgi:hypothetical protein